MTDVELYHHGIIGQKWGVRRYQNEDGTLTDAGKKRYGDGEPDKSKNSETNKSKRDTAKKIATGVAVTATAVAGVALTAYLVKKYGNKDVASVVNMASTGKDAIADIINSTSIASTPVNQIQIPRTEVSRTTVQRTEVPRTEVKRTKIQNNYDFQTLAGQNEDLLKKMYSNILN